MSRRPVYLGIDTSNYTTSAAICDAEGRVLTSLNVSCPPAVPIVVSGEKIDRNAIRAFSYYGIAHCFVMTETE